MSDSSLVVATISSFIVAIFFAIICFCKEKYGVGILTALVMPFVLVAFTVVAVVLYNAISWLLNQ